MVTPYVPPTPPITTPPMSTPQEKSVDVNNTFKQQQDQFQEQDQQTTIGELLQEQRTNSDADSDSSSDSSSVNSSNQSNIQVNNSSNRIKWDGFEVPETSISVSAYANGNDTGGIVTLNIPIGGRSRGNINRAIQTQVALLELDYERQYTSACASISTQGFVVASDAAYAERLAKCGDNIIVAQRQVDVPPPPPVVDNSETEQLRRQNEMLRQRLDEMMVRLNNIPVKGGY